MFLFALIRVSHGGGLQIFIFGAIGAFIGVSLFLRGFRALQQRRLILNTPSSKVRSAAMGLVEVNGLACGPYTLTAPITGLTCYYYRTAVWQWKKSGNESSWQLAAEENLHVPFYLDDNTGRVLVNPDGAEMDLHCDFRNEYSNSVLTPFTDIPGNVYSFLSRNGIDMDHRVKVEEFCIKPKNSLFVLGTLAVNTGGELKPTPINNTDSHTKVYRLPSTGLLGEAATRVLGDAASTPITVRVSTTSTGFGARNVGAIFGPPATAATVRAAAMTATAAAPETVAAALVKAGISNPDAWAAAGIPFPGTRPAVTTSSTVPSAGSATLPAEEFDLKPPTVLMKGEHNPAFFISWKNQCEVLSALGWKSTLMIWGGPALTLSSVWFLATWFGWL